MILILLVAAVLVVVVALVFVGHGVNKASEMPAQIVVDAHETIEFCADALPIEVSSVLSYDDLRRLIRLHLEWIQAYHYTPEWDPAGPIIFEEFDAVDYVVERCAIVRLDVSREHIAAVIEAHSSYLRVVGAIADSDPDLVAIDLATMAMLNPGESEDPPVE